MSLDVSEELVCEFCGLPIEDDEQRCPALDDGWCRP